MEQVPGEKAPRRAEVLDIVTPPERLSVHTEGGVPVMVVVLVEAGALVEEEDSDAALVLVAGAVVMVGEDRMDPLTGLHTLALMQRAPRMNSTSSRMKPAPSKMNLMP
jgi:hypothetical protein